MVWTLKGYQIYENPAGGKEIYFIVVDRSKKVRMWVTVDGLPKDMDSDSKAQIEQVLSSQGFR